MKKLFPPNFGLAIQLLGWLLLLLGSLSRAEAQCNQTIVSDTLTADYNGSPVGFCVDLDYIVAIRSDRFIDGNRQTGFPEGCDFDTLIYYPYSTLPGNGAVGPYELILWTVDGNFLNVPFTDVDDLVAQMNVFDPAGFWINDVVTRNIIGGESGRMYDVMTIEQRTSGIRRTISPNVSRTANGTLVTVNGAGFHEYVVDDPDTGCRDTLTLVLRPVINDDNLEVFTAFNTESEDVCLDLSGLLGTSQTATICDDPDSGILIDQGAYCYSYLPNQGHTGSDVVCIEVCDDTMMPLGPLCKRTFINFITESPLILNTDTVRFQMTNTDTTVCVNAVLELGALPDSAAVCGPVPSGLTIVPTLDGCVDIFPDGSFFGPAVVCISHCNGGVCDTTILEFTVVAGCNFSIFQNATETIPSQGDPTPFCIEIDQTEFSTYDLLVNGQPYAGSLGECNVEQQIFYNYAPLFGNGSAGPYRLNRWAVNGVAFQNTFQGPSELLAFMRATDPTGNWELDAAAFELFGGGAGSNYGPMEIVHIASNSLSNLQPNQVDVARGTTIGFPGDGVYNVELTDPNTGCSDLVSVTVGQVPQTTTQTIQVVVFVDSVSENTCLFTNPRDTFSICQDVTNGTTTFDLNDCVVYEPNPGFLGVDSLCVVSCDLPGGTVCDTTFVIFRVEPRVAGPTQIDTIEVLVFVDSVSENTCLFTNPRDTFSICQDVTNGTTTFDLNDCVIYEPNPGFLGVDSLCVVSCDLPGGTVCDTTFVIFDVVPRAVRTDTIYLTNFGDAPFNLCNGLPIVGPFSSVSVCGVTGPFTTFLSQDGDCIVADPADGVAGVGEICVTFCSATNASVCQNVLFIITQTPSCAPALFAQDTVVLGPSAGSVEYCLANGVDLSDYEVFVNGDLTTPTTDPSCGGSGGGGGGQDVYFYSLQFINDGPLRIDAWDISGNTILNVMTTGFAQLADTMSALDPGNDWTYDPVEQGIVASSNTGNYSQLILFDLSFGLTYTIQLETIQSGGGGGGGSAPGAIITLDEVGIYNIEVIALDGSCGDRLVIMRESTAAPSRDTVTFAAVADQPNGPFCVDVSELGGAAASIQSCGDPINGTITYTNFECFNYEPDPGFTGVDNACVIICTNGGLVCDTTDIVFIVTSISACPEIWDVTTASSTTADCTGLTNVCLPAFPDEFFNYTVSVDGVVQSGALACGADSLTTYSYADVAGQGQVGPYRIEDYMLASGTYTNSLVDVNALVDSLNQWDPNGNWVLNPSNLTISGGVSGFAYDVLQLRQIATDTLNLLVPVTTLIENQIGFDLPVGSFSVSVTDNRDNCTDTLRYSVICTTGNDCPDLTAANGTALTLVDCDGTAEFTVLSPVTDPTLLDVSVDGSIVSTTTAAGSVSILLGEGVFEVVVVDPVRACSSTFTVNVTCGPCPGPLPTTEIGFGADCSASSIEVCLAAAPDVLQAYAITIDGQPYTGALIDCDEIETFTLDVFNLPDNGAFGPYRVDSIRINGQVFSGGVGTPQDLADSLTVWDASGAWRYDSIGNLIIGGNEQSIYSDLFVTEVITGSKAQIPFTLIAIAQGTAITVPAGAGNRMLTFDNGVDCVQEVSLTIACTTSSTAMDTIPVNGVVTFCVDDTELTGPIVTLENVCPDTSGAVSFVLGSPQVACVTVTGLFAGTASSCLVACDSSGVCDTTFYTVVVTPNGSGGLDAVEDVLRIRLDQTGIISVTGNDIFTGPLSSISIVEQPTRGAAMLNPDGTLTYTPSTGECGYTDSLTYQICQGTLCDRAKVFIQVRCESVEAFTGFSPNGDGVNDQLRFIGIEDFPENTLRVYNRWGNEVLVAQNYQNDWEGTWEGKILIDGTYFWLIEIPGEAEPITGFVQIQR